MIVRDARTMMCGAVGGKDSLGRCRFGRASSKDRSLKG
jgi:hypothetical protein